MELKYFGKRKTISMENQFHKDLAKIPKKLNDEINYLVEKYEDIFFITTKELDYHKYNLHFYNYIDGEDIIINLKFHRYDVCYEFYPIRFRCKYKEIFYVADNLIEVIEDLVKAIKKENKV